MVYKKLRIEFEKVGMLRFISHLDLCRTMREAFNRAKVPVAYSEGFNPHPKMTFALPLSVGCESICELMDIKVPEELSEQDIVRALDAVTAPDLHFKRALTPVLKFTDIAAAKYRVKFFSRMTEAEIKSRLESPEPITKTSKKGVEKTVDIKPLILDCTAEGDKSFVLTLCAREGSYLNPATLCDAVLSGDPEGDYSITRLEILDKNGDLFR